MADPRDLERRYVPDWSTAKWIRWRWLWWLPTRRELDELRLDFLAWVNGWCNDCPWDPEVERGGYRFWRCELGDGHADTHRFNNYVWTDHGMVRYAPIPPGTAPDWPRSPYTERRRTTGTWWQRVRHMNYHRPTRAARHRLRREG